MAGLYGENVAKHVAQGSKTVGASAWVALTAGSSLLSNRTHIRIFVRGAPGMTLAIDYANINADGTSFTTPTSDVRHTTIFPGGRTWIEPISDRVQVYGRLLKKGGLTDSSVKVIVTEYS